jgi:aspartyl/glutamyl-tRNA(Asn/Gln) amidotransferase subunit C (EC 6.3.5.-)
MVSPDIRERDPDRFRPRIEPDQPRAPRQGGAQGRDTGNQHGPMVTPPASIEGAAKVSLDAETVRRIAALARIRVREEEVARLQGELNHILAWIEQLSEVRTEGVEPLPGAMRMTLTMREDVVSDGDLHDAILANAPDRADNAMGSFFAVPKVVE